MKILFLDVDGVLNCRTSNFNGNGFPLDPYMVVLVDRIIQATKCLVVLSSSWRNHPDGMFEVSKFIPLIDKTPNLPVSGILRGHEIEYWLSHHPTVKCHDVSKCLETETTCKGHEIDGYAILDDNSDMLDFQMKNFFQTSWEKGITPEIAEKVITHLTT